MSLFDTIEIYENMKNGPFAGEYYTKDLHKMCASFVVQEGKLYKEIIKYEVLPEEERSHPVVGAIQARFLGISFTDHSGCVTMYNSNETWALTFIKGELMESNLIEFVAEDPDDSEATYDNLDTQSFDYSMIIDEGSYTFNPQDYEK